VLLPACAGRQSRSEFFVEQFLASQDVVVVLGEAVGLIPDVLEQLAGGGIGRQLQGSGTALEVNIFFFLGD